MKVLIFGTFDGIHEGHRALFRQAREHGDHLVVAVAQDDVVRQLKHRPPRRNIEVRMAALGAEPAVDAVVPGDFELGSYAVVKKERPHVIALGYDQHALREDIRNHSANFNWDLDIITLAPHRPAQYHTSPHKK